MLNLISHRGPKSTSGLYGSLAQAWRMFAHPGDLWWHMDDACLKVQTGGGAQVGAAPRLGKNLLEGHSRYCQEFIWPLMHDYERYAQFNSEDKLAFDRFNRVFSWHLARLAADKPGDFFVQNYQFAVLPAYLNANTKGGSITYWHIPWPKAVSELYVEPVAELARGLLCSVGLGFQTEEYAANFMHFVEKHLPEYNCDPIEMTIGRHSISTLTKTAQPAAQGQSLISMRPATRLIVIPFGVNFSYWSALAQAQDHSIWHPFVSNMPFVLSVDNADFSQGIAKRLDAVNRFFERYPRRREHLLFVHVSEKAEANTPVLDNYSGRCNEIRASVAGLWERPDWSPLIWADAPLSRADLALLYRQASAFLANPFRDAMCLSTKEFISCQSDNPGVLMLSQGAGAWHELGDCTILVDPHEPEQMAEAIEMSLNLAPGEKALRMNLLQQRVQSKGLANWWHSFRNMVDPAPAMRRTA